MKAMFFPPYHTNQFYESERVRRRHKLKWQQNELAAQLKEEMVGKRGEVIKTGTGISDLPPTEYPKSQRPKNRKIWAQHFFHSISTLSTTVSKENSIESPLLKRSHNID